MLSCIFFLATFLGLSSFSFSAENDYPIIGVFTQPTSSYDGDCSGNCLYVAASYVKYLEAAGARVVPVNYYASEEQLDELFSSVNGFLFPGGGAPYPASAQYIFDKTVAANDAGDFMPLWGTCMGFQWLIVAAARDDTILDPKSGQFDAYNYSIPLDFTKDAENSKLFEHSTDVYKILGTENVTMNNHHYGIYTEHFKSTPSLHGFYRLLSTNKDRAGVEFVSTIEAFKYPIFGTQWHPEKNDFEWGKTEDGVPKEAINHSSGAILIAQYAADFFVQQARSNTHRFANPSEEDDRLIYNYPPTKTDGSFVQQYFLSNDFDL